MPQPKGFTQVTLPKSYATPVPSCHKLVASERIIALCRTLGLAPGKHRRLRRTGGRTPLASHIMFQLQSNDTGPPAMGGTMGQPNSVRTAQ